MRDSSNLPTLLQSFFTTRLMTQRKASLTPSPLIATRSACCSVRAETATQGTLSVGTERSGWRLDWRVSGRPGKTPAQWSQEPQSAADGHPVILPVCLAGGACTERSHSTGVGHSQPTTATCPGGFLTRPEIDAVGGAE